MALKLRTQITTRKFLIVVLRSAFALLTLTRLVDGATLTSNFHSSSVLSNGGRVSRQFTRDRIPTNPFSSENSEGLAAFRRTYTSFAISNDRFERDLAEFFTRGDISLARNETNITVVLDNVMVTTDESFTTDAHCENIDQPSTRSRRDNPFSMHKLNSQIKIPNAIMATVRSRDKVTKGKAKEIIEDLIQKDDKLKQQLDAAKSIDIVIEELDGQWVVTFTLQLEAAKMVKMVTLERSED